MYGGYMQIRDLNILRYFRIHVSSWNEPPPLHYQGVTE
jgi:hypothetical protein